MEKIIRITKLSLLFVTILLFLAPAAFAAYSPVSISIVPPIQFPPSDFSITGFRVSALWGKQRDVYGLDLGVGGNITEQDFTGIGLAGVFNATHGTTRILLLQLAGGANLNTNKTEVYGFQVAGLFNSNTASSSVIGVQLALLANLADHTDVYGVQAGLYNNAQSVYGLQIGLINSAADLHGVQIGLVNFNASGPFSVSPILNVGF